ncbi:MAG: hypothetical protein IK103_07645 [Bacteroidales bacterium]|nr:hypothetical protein [Bacteroidales bacterium]MBR6466066.1 hypothetical protein [Bacteroidales bacterium]
MNKFRFISAVLLIAAVPVLMSCSKKSSSGEEDTTETFQTINAKFYYSNGSLAPENIAMETGGNIELYVGSGSSKAIFNGPVKWTATGSGELGLSAVQKTVGQAPLTKAGYDYNTTSATTNATSVLRINGKSDGIVSLRAADPAGNIKVVMVTVYAKE